jgi:hypothetical protein
MQLPAAYFESPLYRYIFAIEDGNGAGFRCWLAKDFEDSTATVEKEHHPRRKNVIASFTRPND